MVEAYIKHADDDVWERQNVIVDRKLEMLPVKAGEEFSILRREAKKSIGASMMLTFKMAHSETSIGSGDVHQYIINGAILNYQESITMSIMIKLSHSSHHCAL